MQITSVLRGTSDEPGCLTASQYARMLRDGTITPARIRRELAGSCPDCGLSRASRTCRETCRRDETRTSPVAASRPIRQPYEPITSSALHALRRAA